MYIAIDPSYSKNIGVAWAEKNDKIRFNSIKFSKKELKKGTRDLKKIAKKVFDYLRKEIKIVNNKETHIAIEGQFFSINAAMTINLVEVRSLIQGMILARYDKIKQYTVDPRTWQAKVLHVSKMKSKEIKEISIKEANRITGKSVSEDEADAVNILRLMLNDFEPLEINWKW